MMKHSKQFCAKLLTAGLMFPVLSGCGGNTEPTSSSSAPAGFVKIKDATGRIPEGTKIYNADGTLFGTVRAYDANHTFPNGEVGVGTQVELANSGPTLWASDQVLSASKYVKP